MKTKLIVVLLVLFLGLIGEAATTEEPVRATGDNIHGDTAKKITYLQGNVRFVQGATVITTDKATVYTEQKQVTLEGRVKLVNKDGTVTAEALDYNFRKKAGTFRGNVALRRKAVPAQDNKVQKDPFTLYGDELFLDTQTKNFTATRGRFEHQDFRGTADQISYSDSDEEMVFSGHVDLKRTKGEAIRGEEVRIYLKDKSFTAADNVSVQIEVDDDEADQKKKDQGQTAPAKAAQVKVSSAKSERTKPAKQNEPVQATGDRIRGDTENKVTYFEGHVRITQGTTVITTDKATVYTDKKQAFLEKQIRLTNPDGTVDAETLDYDLRKKAGTFRGNVALRRKAVPARNKQAKKEPFTLNATELFLETQTKNFTAVQGRLKHQDFWGSADRFSYNDRDEEMVLRGQVDLQRTNGEAIKGEETRIFLKDKSFVSSDNVMMQIQVDDD
jgi:lipopolysaccharide export system protein LptA